MRRSTNRRAATRRRLDRRILAAAGAIVVFGAIAGVTQISRADETTAASSTKADKTVNGLTILTNTCADSKLTPHDGFQKGDRCVSTEFGEVGSAANNPSLLITQAPRSVDANTPFTLKVSTRNLIRDRFLAAGQGGYYVESSVLQNGIVRGHFHTACRMLSSTKVAPAPDPVPAFFVATEDKKGGRTPDTVTINVPGLPAAGTAQCASWAGDGSHRIPMMERANQTPALDAVRITVRAGGNNNGGGANSGGGGANNGGGQNTGGQNTGGQNTGGQNTGGQNTGGQNTGGQNTGGQNTGGQNTGGQNTGGQNTGGQNNGGAQQGGDNGGMKPPATTPPTTKPPVTGGTNTGGTTTKGTIVTNTAPTHTPPTHSTSTRSSGGATSSDKDENATEDTGTSGDEQSSDSTSTTTTTTTDKKTTKSSGSTASGTGSADTSDDGAILDENAQPDADTQTQQVTDAAPKAADKSSRLALTGTSTVMVFGVGAILLIAGLIIFSTTRRRPGGYR
jgi:hypothetical protein